MHVAAKFPSLYPILDSGFLPPDADARHTALRELVVELAQAGVEILQYRNKQGTQAEILTDALAMRAAAGPQLKLILNDWPELAVQANFNGVHVGQTDMLPQDARGILGPDRVLGVSTHNEAQLRAAATAPADYIAVGPVFATSSKQNPDPVIGLEGVRLARSLTTTPLVAIGGITLETAQQVCDAGADSIAVISAIFSAGKSPANLAKDFLRIFR
jgi:thiamine-phosphate pyrophosphorylase